MFKIWQIFILLFLSIAMVACKDGTGDHMKISEVFPDKKIQKLILLAQKGYVKDIINLIRVHDVDINKQGRKGLTPLLWCLYQKDKKGFESLLSAGADPNVNPELTENVVVVAACIEDYTYLEMLLNHGADPNIIAVGHATPLMKAAYNEREKNIKLLLERGGDLDMRIADGTTAALYTSIMDLFEMTLILLKEGADYRIVNERGRSIAYSVHDSNLRQGTQQYQAKEKVREFLINNGVTFPPESPIEVRKRLKLLEFSDQ